MRVIQKAYFEGDLEGVSEIVRSPAWIEALVPGKPSEAAVSTTEGGVDIHLPVEGLVDIDKELARLEKESIKLQEEREKLGKRLADPNFIERAKPEIIEREKARFEELAELTAKNEERAKLFKRD
jgi:valyl-tRNA synthetase